MHPEKDILSGHRIQPMTADDLDEVLKIEVESFPKPWTREMFESELRNPVSYARTLKISPNGIEAIAAYIVFWVVKGEAHILNIAVSQGFRRKGCATILLAACLEEMRRSMVYEVFLEVRRSNAAARDLYRRFGFREIFERRNYYGDEDAIVMALEF